MGDKKKSTGRTERLVNYLEIFTIPDIWWQTYPVYHVSSRGNMFSLKSILFPNSRSCKKYTRKNQLIYRSLQAKMFDCIVNIGYFDPLPVVREFPFVIQNHNRFPGQKGSYYLADYLFPTALGGKGLIVELDSDYHHPDSDGLRDRYLQETYGIQTFRIKNFEKENIQKGKFKELCELLRSEQPSQKPRVFNFMPTIQGYIREKLGGKSLSSSLPLSLISDEDLENDDEFI